MKLGELFVDLGVDSGNALNSLAMFSGKFLTLGKMAQEVTRAIGGLYGGMTDYVVGLRNQNLITGVSIDAMQKLKFRADQLGISYEGVFNSLKAIQKANANILMGKGGYSGFQKLNIEVNRLRNPLELMNETMEKLVKYQPAFRNAIMDEIGLNKELYILYTQKSKALDESLLITKEDTSSVSELKKEWESVSNSIDLGFKKILISTAPILKDILGTSEKIGPALAGAGKEIEKVTKKGLDLDYVLSQHQKKYEELGKDNSLYLVAAGFTAIGRAINDVVQGSSAFFSDLIQPVKAFVNFIEFNFKTKALMLTDTFHALFTGKWDGYFKGISTEVNALANETNEKILKNASNLKSPKVVSEAIEGGKRLFNVQPSTSQKSVVFNDNSNVVINSNGGQPEELFEMIKRDKEKRQNSLIMNKFAGATQ